MIQIRCWLGSRTGLPASFQIKRAIQSCMLWWQITNCTNAVDIANVKSKCGGVFVTTCKSNFPRTPQEKTVLQCVEEKLKKRQRIYELAHSEVRVNDYNPLLLLLWQANMDIQFVAESLSL